MSRSGNNLAILKIATAPMAIINDPAGEQFQYVFKGAPVARRAGLATVHA